MTCDQYPYTAGSGPFQTIMPPWSLAGGAGELLGRLRDPAARARMVRAFEGRDPIPGWDNMSLRIGWDRIVVGSASGREGWEGRSLAAMAADSEFTPVVRRLGCLRGIGDLTGFALAVEIGDWHRFTGATIGAFVGLVPSEHSSGATRSQGPITKTGNTHVRRLLVEAAWHHRARYVAGKTMRDRWDLAAPAARARGDAGNRRLHDRWNTFRDRRKRHTVANVAIARELAGWCWSLAVLED